MVKHKQTENKIEAFFATGKPSFSKISDKNHLFKMAVDRQPLQNRPDRRTIRFGQKAKQQSLPNSLQKDALFITNNWDRTRRLMKTSRPAVCSAGDDRGQLDHIAPSIKVGLESTYRSESDPFSLATAATPPF
ncbi:hypothetical protein OUZ56_010722 [Daphnia magna]|uniref:Uncharacterized protein n=1 Tax=Daphnia magna TaxID=35525 RepID=A0ABQ9YZN9_9CRUS|nr:hypothetical protein OUZ56_010722 [Daphnia magna]